ncbi:MAG: DUF4263 domain-containing protein [Burkholderiaceae bacterium]|nr:DUF4263 domain-containing protein [Burkholderiaceae bacterium]
MKTDDFIFRFPTCGLTKFDAICRVRLFSDKGNEKAALLTDLGDKNTGASVTNSIEKIRANLIQYGHIKFTSTVIEHYEGRSYFPQSFDLVSFDSESNPSWKKISVGEAAEILSCDETELNTLISANEMVVQQIDRIRHEINPRIDEPTKESDAVIARREKIKSSMISRKDLTSLVAAGAGEHELQRLIKRDLSIIAEVYASLEGEYLAFSEFPVGDGIVDFVIFSGRSRMDVTLIEIKGADFNLLNISGYENFAAKFNEAAQQMRTRLGYIKRNYHEFRPLVHSIRKNVELGYSKFNSLHGPRAPLAVDPNKDIKIHGVVIGGRSSDDLYESKLRHDFELESAQRIKIESWDSWLKKVDRE